MAALTIRQRAEVNAALACLHYNDINAGAVEASARAMIRGGRNPADAYTAAVTNAVSGRPDLGRRLERISAQLDASDDGTVAQYDCALREYIASGNPAALHNVERIAMRDAVELAFQNGEISREDAAAGRADWSSVGLSAEGVAAAYAEGAVPAPVSSSFAFTGGEAAQPISGVAASWTKHGYSAARAKPEWQNALTVTGTRSPYEGMSAGQIRAVMRGETNSNESL